MTPTENDVRKELSRWKWFFLKQKYRFDLGHQFLALLNFSLLLIASSDKLRYYTGISRTWILICLAIPMGFLGMWLFGLFLDRVVRYAEGYNIEANKRNPIWAEQKEALLRIEKELQALSQKLK